VNACRPAAQCSLPKRDSDAKIVKYLVRDGGAASPVSLALAWPGVRKHVAASAWSVPRARARCRAPWRRRSWTWRNGCGRRTSRGTGTGKAARLRARAWVYIRRRRHRCRDPCLAPHSADPDNVSFCSERAKILKNLGDGSFFWIDNSQQCVVTRNRTILHTGYVDVVIFILDFASFHDWLHCIISDVDSCRANDKIKFLFPFVYRLILLLVCLSL